ncbi:hypothetical protein C5023_000245 [Staphylococcus phage vB_SauM_0414_108]|nr:hypothetical protein C5023_000021 [Staphylococcus phage vB_SauM_0414_108]AVX47599.1 hypothetical protein C5023_000245 [Staphylococcus phage vB_SauM_0414_108]WPH67160.1 hypothetical protein CUBB_gp244 [Staphylococcus phage CUB-B]
MIILNYTKEKELIQMKLINRDNEIVISIATLESVKQALIWEYIDHLDNNILDSKIYDQEAVVVTSDTLQSIKFADTMEELEEYVNDIGWKLI